MAIGARRAHAHGRLLGSRIVRATALAKATLVFLLSASRAGAATPVDGQWCGVNDGGRGVGFVVGTGGTKIASGFFAFQSLFFSVWERVTVVDVPISGGQFDYTRTDNLGVCIGSDHVWGTFNSSTSASGGVQSQSGGGASCPIDYGLASWTAAPVGTTQADLAVTLSGSTPVATPPSQLILTTIVTNRGGLPADGVEVNAATPAGLTFVGNSGDCNSAFPCALGTLAACENRTITSVFDIPSAYAGPDVVHTVTATTTATDANPSNNHASWTTTILHPGPPARLWVLEPCRLLDTREGLPLSAGTERTLVAVGHCGVPSTARSLAVNVTVTSPDHEGDLRLFPAGLAAPLASTINFRAGETRANNAVVDLGPGGALVIHVDQTAGASVHAIVDVAGYFE